MAWRAVLVLVCTLLVWAGPAEAQSAAGETKSAIPQNAIGFSKLLFRLQHEDRIGIAKGEFAIFILEALRARGFNAVGAENLVFDQDRSTEAEFVLGGTVRELECLSKNYGVNCRIAIEWQLLSVRAGRVVYTALTRGLTLRADPRNPAALGKSLVVGALESLSRRPPFRNVLQASAAPVQAASHPEAEFSRCPASNLAMPEAAEQVLPATAFVQAGDGFGSGFFLNSEGLLLTAAHVVANGPLKVRLRDGSTHSASVIRTAPNVDAALLKIDAARAPALRCLDLGMEQSAVGSEIYAIGAPAREDLAFSLTRGIVSGSREIDGQRFLQTDASVNPGNSGGPLVDRQGRAVALISWKLAGTAIQGVAFGVPVEAALRGLGLRAGGATDAALSRPSTLPPSEAPRPVTDGADQLPSLDPEADQAHAEKVRQEKLDRLRDERTPAAVKVMRWVGLGVAIAGTVGIAVTYSKYDKDSSTRSEYDTLNLLNKVSWVGAGVGAASFTVSYFLVPSVDEKEVASGSGHGVRVQVGF